MGRTNVTKPTTVVLCAIALCSALSIGAEPFPFRTVALSGQAAPGAQPGSVFDVLDARGIDAQGRVLYWATLTGPLADESHDTGLWLGSRGGLTPVAVESERAADTDTAVIYGHFDSETEYLLSPDGTISFANWLSGSGLSTANDGALFVGPHGGLHVLARESEQAGDISLSITYGSQAFDQYRGPPTNNGYVSFHAVLAGPGVTFGNHTALFAGPFDDVRLVARRGSQAAGTPSGATYGSFSTSSRIVGPPVNDSGKVAFFAKLDGAGVTDRNNRGIWVGDAGGVTLVARKGDRPPGMPSGVFFHNVDNPSINNSGEVAFSSILGGPGITSSNDDDVIWVGTPGNLELLARASSPAPGTDSTFDSLYANPILTQSGEVMFMATLTGGGTSFWVGKPGDLRKVVAQGDPRPDGAGTFRLQYTRPAFSNGRGQVSFIEAAYGAPVSLWATDLTGALQLACEAGDSFEVAPGDTRVISYIRNVYGGWGNETGFPTYFNDNSELLMTLDFTDGSQGVFVAIVPEPTTSWLLLGGLALLSGFRRRRRPGRSLDS